MSALQSLPRITREAATTLPTVPAAWRGRAATRLSQAVRQRHITPSMLARALEEGDPGIARLMMQKARLPALPLITGKSIQLHRRKPERGELITLSALLRSLQEKGLVEAEDLTHPDAHAAAKYACIKGLNRIEGQVRERLAGITPSGQLHAPFNLTFTDLESGYPREATTVIELNLSLNLTPMVEIPTYPDSADMIAVNSALAAVNRASKMSLFVPPKNVLEALNGYYYEQILDVAIHSTWSRDKKELVLKPFARELLEEEMGIDINDPDHIESVADAIRYLQRKPPVTWKPNSASMQSWLKKQAGTPQHTLVQTLLQCARELDKLPKINNAIHMEPEGEICAVLVLPPEGEVPWMLTQCMEHYGESGEPVAIGIFCPAHLTGELCKLYERVLLEVSLVTLAMNAILKAHD